MNQMRVKSSIKEVRGPTTALRTEPTMAPAWWEWNDDDSTLIADEDMMGDEGDEGDGESVVCLVAGVEVRKDGEMEYTVCTYSVIQEFLTGRTNCERSGHRSPVGQHSCHFGIGCFHYRNRRVYLNSDAKRFAISCKGFKRRRLDAHGGLNEIDDIILYWGIKSLK